MHFCKFLCLLIAKSRKNQDTWGQNVCVCLEEHREVFTQGLPVMAKVETHIPWQPLWWIQRTGNSVLAAESPNLHPVSLTDPSKPDFGSPNCGGFCFHQDTRHKAAVTGVGRTGHLSTAALGVTSQNLHFHGMYWGRIHMGLLYISEPWCANHTSLSAGCIIAVLWNYEYSNYRSMTLVTRRQRMGKIAIVQSHKSFSCINSYS